MGWEDGMTRVSGGRIDKGAARGRPLARLVDIDHTSPGLLRLLDLDVEYPVLEAGLHLLRVDIAREAQGTRELAAETLPAIAPPTGDAAIIKVQPLQPVSIEKQADFPELAKFAIRDMGKTVAAGICTDLVKAK